MRSGWRARRRLNRMMDFGWSRAGSRLIGEKPSNSAAGPGGPGGAGTSTAADETHRARENACGDAACVNGSLHGLHKHLDHLDHLEPASNGAAFPGPCIAPPSDRIGPALLGRPAPPAFRCAWPVTRLRSAVHCRPNSWPGFAPISSSWSSCCSGDRCQHCNAPLLWATPDAVMFADGLAAHLACYERAEALRQSNAAAKRTLPA